MLILLFADGGATVGIIMSVVAAVIILLVILIALATRYKKCPSDKIMVIFGSGLGKTKDGKKRSSLCMHGGARLVWPFFQNFSYMDLTPISISVDLKNALSKQNIRIDVPSIFTVGISTEPGIMQNAAERLRSLKLPAIQELAKDIIFGQLRLVIATMDIEEINTNRDKFLDAVSLNVESELKKVGLRLINVNVTDINDESGYIAALGKEAAAKAINDAKKSVAEKNRDGAIGEAMAVKEERIELAQANSIAVEGENESKAKISQSNAKRREIVAEKIAAAKAKEEAYKAEQQAEIERAKKEKSTLEADVITKALIEKQKIELEAEAEAEKQRRQAQGEADALLAMKEAEARGTLEVLSKQAEGFKKIIEAAGGDTNEAVKMMLSDKMEQLVALQVEAIKNIKIDKVTVWDSMNNGNGGSTTANFMSSMMKAVPPLNDLFKLNNMELPEYLGKIKDGEENTAKEEKTASEKN